MAAARKRTLDDLVSGRFLRIAIGRSRPGPSPRLRI